MWAHPIRARVPGALTLRTIARGGDGAVAGDAGGREAAHARRMAPVTPPPPGSPTVPLLFGWQHVMVVLVVLVVVAVGCLVLMAAGPARHDRSELEALLRARSTRRPDPAGDPRSGAGGRPADAGTGNGVLGAPALRGGPPRSGSRPGSR